MMRSQLDGEGPLYRQIYRHIRQAILSGELAPDSRLPASRRLARELGVSRITVVQAYEQLIAEGYLEAKRGAGTRVTGSLHGLPGLAKDQNTPTPSLSSYADRALAAFSTRPQLDKRKHPLRWDFQYGRPETCPDLLVEWRRALRRATERPLVDYPDPQGLPVLRECVAAHLRSRRGLLADPEQIMIVSGAQQGLELIGRCLLEPGDSVLLEEPHYQGARYAFQALGASLMTVPVDADGLCTSVLPYPPPANLRLACLTPSHQFPLGGVLPVSRRLTLLEWAARYDVTLIEDDYDSEYRHEGLPLQSLYGLDGGRRVLYVGTFSKVLFPALRVGYVILPEPWIEPMRHVKWLADRGTPGIEQLALSEIFRSGAFRRHVNRMARILAEKRRMLVKALTATFGDRVEVLGTQAGMHLVTRWKQRMACEERAMVEAAADHGIGIYGTRSYRIRPASGPAEILLGYATLPTDEIEPAVSALHRAIVASGG